MSKKTFIHAENNNKILSSNEVKLYVPPEPEKIFNSKRITKIIIHFLILNIDLYSSKLLYLKHFIDL